MKRLSLILLFIYICIFSQTFILTNDGVYKSFEKILSGSFLDMFYFNNTLYLIGKDEILNFKANKSIYVESPIYIGEGYVFSKNRLYFLKDDKLTLIRVISNISQPFIYKDVLFAIRFGNVIALDNGKIIWNLSPDKGKITKIRVSNNILAVFSTYNLSLFDITNPKYPKFIKKFNLVDDYIYNGYHVLLKDNIISIYDNNNKLIFSQKVNEDKLITDGENIIVGNYLITKDLNITTYPFKIKAFVSINEKIETVQSKFDMLWKASISSDISGKPVAKDGTLFLTTTNGKIMKIHNGKIEWSYTLPFIVTGHLTLLEDAILVPCWDDYIYSFDFSGNLLWKIQLDSDITLGAAYDGQIIYVVSDEGFLYEIKDGKVISSSKIGKWPISGPYISLSGQIYTIDGMGYLWKNNKKEKFVGNIKNLAFSLENPQIPPENSIILLDGTNKIIFNKDSVYINNIKVITFEFDILDGVIGKKYLYILTYDGILHIFDKNSIKVLKKVHVENTPKFLILDNIGNLYVIGKTINVIATNDTPSDPWNSMLKNFKNSSAVNY
ncbi:PQQ-binding-like beta-propeller repeat protein [Thermosipho melanesiensis]|uniref:Pyrrolo-quinoline quinone n=2 Tax=Thermosipho melanesiensis TaxID=46541 RepID=A6LP72_THEM4|nr:PQQ-binding-like beta-propeller repeat protein [Thermosipho melanesiensis]ABR31723.1 Pyrrolo-quinoline quinone [Thermosipho melanesiensis BI429]